MNVLTIPTTSDYNSKIEYYKKFKLKRIKDINIYLTYINLDNEIENISRRKLYIENRQNTITRSQLVDVIKNFQRKSNISYKLISIMVYNIHVTPESLPNYIENPNDFISLYTLNRIDSFELKPTLRLLKKYNGIYFFFFECPEKEVDSDHTTLLSRQELITNGLNKNKNNNTKRIHIRSLHKQKKQNNNKTKRCDRYVNLL